MSNTDTLLLGSGYIWEVVIFDVSKNESKVLLLDEENALQIKKTLTDPNIRFVDIGGSIYFWSDVRKVERVKVPNWLDKLLFTSGQIVKVENRKKVLRELARRSRDGRKFRDEDDVFNFLYLNQ